MRKYLRKLKRRIVAARYFLYDAKRYLRNASYLSDTHSDSQLSGRLFAHAHCIEKGLALPEPRPGFGKPMIMNLVKLLREFRSRNLHNNSIPYQMGIGALHSYISFHDSNPELIADITAAFKNLEVESEPSGGGTVEMTREEILAKSNSPFPELAFTRHSVRKYSGEQVDAAILNRAIEIAQRTPSVCNRQGGRVHVLESKTVQEKALAFQNGNRGFGDTADKILIVTVDLRIFDGISERNQAYIDGGMFAMSLVYALSSLGLATCCLNWSAKIENDMGLRELGLIGDHETVIMFLSVGHYAETFSVAVSPRHNQSEILTRH